MSGRRMTREDAYVALLDAADWLRSQGMSDRAAVVRKQAKHLRMTAGEAAYIGHQVARGFDWTDWWRESDEEREAWHNAARAVRDRQRAIDDVSRQQDGGAA